MNSLYRFLIFAPLLTLGHGLKMCILFEYNTQILFATFLQNELSHFSDQSE